MTTSLNDAYAPPNPSFDKKFVTFTFGLLIAIILYTTFVHHFQPHIFRVPSNTDIASWKYPSFENTLLYDRMTEAERATFLANGVPGGDNILYSLPGDIMVIFFGLLVFIHSMKYCGLWMSACFLIGSFIFTGLEESMFIILGRVLPPDTVNYFNEPVAGTYWFTKGFFWFIETPITACVGWYFIAYTCVLTAGRVFPKMGLLWRASVGGLIAMGIDLWIDPVITSPEHVAWVWPKGAHLIILGIPVTNFVGWFNLIFLFAIFWEMLPKLEARWGRAKATAAFFIILFVAEIGIAFFFLGIWPGFIGSLLETMGYNHVVMFPAGW